MLGEELSHRWATFRVAQRRNDTAWFIENHYSLWSRSNRPSIDLDLVDLWVYLATKLSNNLPVNTHPPLFDELLHLSARTNTTFGEKFLEANFVHTSTTIALEVEILLQRMALLEYPRQPYLHHLNHHH